MARICPPQANRAGTPPTLGLQAALPLLPPSGQQVGQRAPAEPCPPPCPAGAR